MSDRTVLFSSVYVLLLAVSLRWLHVFVLYLLVCVTVHTRGQLWLPACIHWVVRCPVLGLLCFAAARLVWQWLTAERDCCHVYWLLWLGLESAKDVWEGQSLHSVYARSKVTDYGHGMYAVDCTARDAQSDRSWRSRGAKAEEFCAF